MSKLMFIGNIELEFPFDVSTLVDKYEELMVVSKLIDGNEVFIIGPIKLDHHMNIFCLSVYIKHSVDSRSYIDYKYEARDHKNLVREISIGTGNDQIGPHVELDMEKIYERIQRLIEEM